MPSASHLHELLARRAECQVRQSHLVVDYYRIRRKLAFPLPVLSPAEPDFPTALSATYPWSIWLSWSLEDRLHLLAWAIEAHEPCAEKAASCLDDDLRALARWPVFVRGETPDLMLGHMGRVIATAHQDWQWLSETLRDELRTACGRIIHAHEAWLKTAFAKQLAQPADLAHPMHNIPLIGAMGALCAAHIAGHSSTETWRSQLEEVLLQWLSRYTTGYTEALCYDGYIFDHAIDCFRLTGPRQLPAWMTTHPALATLLAQSYELAVPGAMQEAAAIGDVEPRHMPFHLSNHIKLLDSPLCPSSRWLVEQLDLSWLRSDALVALEAHLRVKPWEQPSPPPLPSPSRQGQYAHILRTGWNHADLAAVISSTTSTVGHLHLDAGSVVLGTQGQWLISDPGYQQYLQKTERKFTLGATAHNCPVINEQAQTVKGAGKPLPVRGDHHFGIDLTACHGNALPGLATLHRHLWLLDANTLIIADHLRGQDIRQVDWHWHGHPDAGWWAQASAALIHLQGVSLWITSPGLDITPAHIHRLSGSRGQQTLAITRQPGEPGFTSSSSPALEQVLTQWWIFTLGRQPAPSQLGGADLQVAGRNLNAQPERDMPM